MAKEQLTFIQEKHILEISDKINLMAMGHILIKMVMCIVDSLNKIYHMEMENINTLEILIMKENGFMAEKKGEEKCQLLEIILKGIGIKRKLMANINGLEEIVMREVL